LDAWSPHCSARLFVDAGAVAVSVSLASARARFGLARSSAIRRRGIDRRLDFRQHAPADHEEDQAKDDTQPKSCDAEISGSWAI
jgi:hypothetical protein